MIRPDSIYDDHPDTQYQFPRQYLKRARTAEGDWIVYLEPKKVRASRGYFAIARIQQIIPDPKADGMYLAVVEPGSYLDFASPVSFSDSGEPIEQGLLNDEGKLSGRAQAAVRPISPSDFLRIIEAGIDEREPLMPRLDPAPHMQLEERQQPFVFQTERERLERLTSRIVRDRAFRSRVLRTYDERCAFTGLKFINGGGRAEVDAAHIRPVAAGGPDIVQNGIALSGTAHWMFDRGLISLSDQFEILISRQVNDIDSVRGFVNQSGHAWYPKRESERPHPRFIQWHRENCFKQ